MHNNDVNDQAYRKFVSPITDAIKKDFVQEDMGLDFGAGPGPVISRVLSDCGFHIEQYDPFFFNIPELLDRKYHYLACCEVIEHFFNPEKEFALLKKLLLSGGKLYCMTDLFSEDKIFETWYYKDDPTHVFFYQAKTLLWIKERFGFQKMETNGRLIAFCN
jgi:hypothetical protein